MQIALALGLSELRPLPQQGFQIAAQRRQRGSQVVRHIGEQLPALFFQAVPFKTVLFNARGHGIELSTQGIDFIRRIETRRVARAGRIAAVRHSVVAHDPAQATQTPGQAGEHEQPGQQRREQRQKQDHQRRLEDVTGADHVGHAVELFAAQHDIQIALAGAVQIDRRRREHLATVA